MLYIKLSPSNVQENHFSISYEVSGELEEFEFEASDELQDRRIKSLVFDFDECENVCAIIARDYCKALEIAKAKRTSALLFAQSLQKKLREDHAYSIEVSYEK